MQTEMIKYLYTLIRRTEIQNTDNTNSQQEHDITKIQLFPQECKMIWSFQKTIWWFLTRTSHMIQYYTLLFTQRNQKVMSTQTCMYICNSFIYIYRNVEVPKIPTIVNYK